MDWRNAKVPQGCKLFKAHHFTFMHRGHTYSLEIDEYADGSFAGHGEHSTDKSNAVESVSGKTLDECLTLLMAKIEGRGEV